MIFETRPDCQGETRSPYLRAVRHSAGREPGKKQRLSAWTRYGNRVRFTDNKKGWRDKDGG